MRSFLPGLEEKSWDDENMAKGTGLEHGEYLVMNLYLKRFGC